MRRIVLSFVLLFATLLSLHAKEPVEQIKPSPGDHGFQLDINGLINNIDLNTVQDPLANYTLLYKYALDSSKFFRLSFGLTRRSQKWSTADSVNRALVEWDSTFKKTDFYIAPGIEKHFELANKRFDPYWGAEFRVGILGKSQMQSTREEKDTTGTSTLLINGNRAGGYLIGLSALAGFNYYLTTKLALGVEYSLSLRTLHQGGDETVVIEDRPVSGSSTSNRILSSAIDHESTIKVDPMTRVTLSYFFTKPKKKKKKKVQPAIQEAPTEG